MPAEAFILNPEKELGILTPIQTHVEVGPDLNGGIDNPFSAVLQADDVALMLVQQNDEN